MVNFCLVVAKLNNKDVTLELVSEETRATKEYKEINPTNKFPLLETPEGTLQESIAIAKFLAHGGSMLGANAVERAQIDQFCSWIISGTFAAGYPAIMASFGQGQVEQATYNEGVKALKDAFRVIDQSLKGDWLVGNKVSVADIALAAFFSIALQTVLDAGFRKAAAKASAWYTRVSSLKEFVAVFGHCTPAAKALKPVFAKKEEPKKKEAAPQPKPAAKPKSDVNPLDALPPSPWNFFDFKTLMVNHKDIANGGMEELKKQYDPVGYSFWFLHYDKYGDEGKVEYIFENMYRGFLQRFDHFRKHTLARQLMLGEEPCLEIQGVWCFRGQQIPQELIDHPEFEYYHHRKLDFNNEKDF